MIWRSLIYRCTSFVRRRRLEREQREEMEFHLDMETEKNLKAGLDPAEARRLARASFGAIESHRLALRDGGGFPAFEAFFADLKLAFRTLRRSPLLTSVIVITLAIGIAATSSIFSAVNEVLIRPLPYEEPDRLVVVTSRHQEREIQGANISYLNFRSWQEESEGFDGLGIYTERSVTLSGLELPMRLSGSAISSEVLEVLGIEPHLGRAFAENEDEAGADPVVILGHGLWRQLFGSRESMIGESLTLDGLPHTIIGVMPAGFRFPYASELWLPLVPGEAHDQRAARFLLGAVGRLDDGETHLSAQRKLEAVCTRLAASFPDANEGWDAAITPLLDRVVGPLKPALLILQVAALLVLLVVCGNIASLLLARGLQRRQEFAMRTTLGAGRRRLVSLLLTEGLVLAALGMLASLPLLWLALSELGELLVDRLGVISSLSLDPSIFVFSLLVSLFATLLFGWLPALLNSRVGTDELASTRTSQGRKTSRLRQGFVVAQLVLVVVLLAGASLLIRSLHAVQGIDPGFDADGILSAQIGFTESDYPDGEARSQALRTILERLAAIPGVEAVGAAQGLPFSGWNAHYTYVVEGEPPPVPGQELSVHAQAVTPGFHRLLGVELLEGREFQSQEGDAQPVALVNESFVQRHFPGGDALDKRFRFGAERWYTIVGVLADFRHMDLTSPSVPAVYIPWSTWSPRGAGLAVKSNRDVDSLIPDFRRTLAEIAPSLPPDQIEPLDQAVSRESFNARLVRDLLSLFAAVAMFLALVGLYGVISYSASTRRREFGIRVALGATPRRLTGEMMKQGLRLAAAGISLGLIAGLILSRSLESLLYGVEARDPATFFTIGVLALCLCSAATWLPAWRAAKENPVRAIRNE